MKLQEMPTTSARKPKVKKKGSDEISSLAGPDSAELQGQYFLGMVFVFVLSSTSPSIYMIVHDLHTLGATIRSFCEMLEDFCGRAEIHNDEQNDTEWVSLPTVEITRIVNEITSMRSKKLLHLVSVDSLMRVLRVLDHHIHRAEGLSVDGREHVSYHSYPIILSCWVCKHVVILIMLLLLKIVWQHIVFSFWCAGVTRHL